MNRKVKKLTSKQATPVNSKSKRSPKTDSIPPDLRKLITTFKHLPQQALEAYTPLVEDVIQNASRDKRQIEHLLDGILGFCFDEKMLALFKRLCRHYYYIDPKATADYVYMYRDMWNEKAKEAIK